MGCRSTQSRGHTLMIHGHTPPRGTSPASCARAVRSCVLALGLFALASCRAGELPGNTTTSFARCSPGSPPFSEAVLRIDARLSERAREEGIPGMAAGIVCGDALAWSAGYGVSGLDDSLPVTPATRFRIASVTKLLTATAILQLRDAGALDLDDPVRLHLPWFLMGRGPDVGDTPVTIRHLLTHTGGLPRDSRLTDVSRRHQPNRLAAIASLPDEVIQATPGARYSFSHLGYSVLGEVITAVTGLPYARIIRDSLLVPLGMTQTLVHPTPADTFLPPRARGDSSSAPAIGFRDMGFAVPAGGLVSSVEDLSRFLVMQLAPYGGGDRALLVDSSVFAMHRVQSGRDSTGGGAGFGWRVDTSSNGHVVRDGGETPEQNAYLAIDLPRGIGIILLTNIQGAGIAEWASEMLDILRSALDS